MPSTPPWKLACTLGALAAALAVAPASALAQQRGGIVKVATIGEPPTMDPMISTADLVGTISQHIFETLYTFDKEWKITPLLAEELPAISADGKVYTIKLRQGIKFHNGAAMTADDVVASLKRWTTVATRGKQTADKIESIEKLDASTVRVSLKSVYVPFLSLLSFNNSAAIVLPVGLQDNPMKEIVGTGPYRLQERKPDQYIRLARFDGYKPRAGEPNGYGGARKQYVDEIQFIPVADPNTRVEGAVAGQFEFSSNIPVESFERFKGSAASVPVLLKPFGWPAMVFNTRKGLMTKQDARLAVRAALNLEDMLAAAFGNKAFYALNGSMYPKTYAWYTEAGVKGAYNLGDAEQAAALLKKVGYDNTPVRILTSRQYEFHYKMAQVAVEYLKVAGFKVDLQVVDWATLTQRRTNPDLWDIYISDSPFLPEPALIGQLDSSSPGGWTSPARTAAMNAFNGELDPQKRIAAWAEVQKVVYAESPVIKVGDYNALYAQSPKLEGVPPAPWPYFWNASLKK